MEDRIECLVVNVGMWIVVCIVCIAVRPRLFMIPSLREAGMESACRCSGLFVNCFCTAQPCDRQTDKPHCGISGHSKLHYAHCEFSAAY